MSVLNGGGTKMTASSVSAEWPFTTDEVVVRCSRRLFGGVERPVVTIVAEGKEYGLNGAAMGVGGYPEPGPIRRRDNRFDTLISVDEIMQAGLERCGWRKWTLSEPSVSLTF